MIVSLHATDAFVTPAKRPMILKECSQGHQWYVPTVPSDRLSIELGELDIMVINGRKWCVRCLEEFMTANIGEVL